MAQSKVASCLSEGCVVDPPVCMSSMGSFARMIPKLLPQNHTDTSRTDILQLIRVLLLGDSLMDSMSPSQDC